jgi:hypothetical protein
MVLEEEEERDEVGEVEGRKQDGVIGSVGILQSQQLSGVCRKFAGSVLDHPHVAPFHPPANRASASCCPLRDTNPQRAWHPCHKVGGINFLPSGARLLGRGLKGW